MTHRAIIEPSILLLSENPYILRDVWILQIFNTSVGELMALFV
ncbi:hypothetical protein [Cerasicoccus frondis]|nr:hypothetical protein [Cerasicoccus frondis]